MTTTMMAGFDQFNAFIGQNQFLLQAAAAGGWWLVADDEGAAFGGSFFLFGICEDVIFESQNDKTLFVSWGCGPARARILVNIRIIALLGSRILHDPTILDVFPWKTYIVKRGLLKCDGTGKGVSFQDISGIFGGYAKFWASTFFFKAARILDHVSYCHMQSSIVLSTFGPSVSYTMSLKIIDPVDPHLPLDMLTIILVVPCTHFGLLLWNQQKMKPLEV